MINENKNIEHPTLIELTQNFHFYKIRFDFWLSQALKLDKWWHIRFRGIIGKILYEYPILYNTLFKKENQDAAMVISPTNPTKIQFEKSEIISVYFTFVHANIEDIQSFIDVFGHLEKFSFFGIKATPVSIKILNKQQQYQNFNPHYITVYQQGQDNSLYPIWEDYIKIKILTPLTFRKDQSLIKDIEALDLLKRIYNRIVALYIQQIDSNYRPEAFLELKGIKTIFNNLSFSSSIVHNQKDYSGVLGEIIFQIPYHPFYAWLLYCGQHLHLGNMVNGGNGRFEIKTEDDSKYFQLLVQEIKSSNFPEKDALATSISNQSYLPQPLSQINIPKSDGTYRNLEIPQPIDAFLQKTLADILSNQLDKYCLPQSMAYQKGKSAGMAITMIQKWKTQYPDAILLRCDIDNFFDSIPIPLLLNKLYFVTKDFKLIQLIEAWVKSATVTKKGKLIETAAGISQGSPLSPILSNIYLHSLDQFIAEKITKTFVRYADDILLVLPKDKVPFSVLQQIQAVLKDKLKLQLNQEITICNIQDPFEFLGISFWGKNKLSVSPHKLWKMGWQAQNYLNLDTSLNKLIEYIEGLKKYYGKLLSEEDIKKIDNELYQAYLKYLGNIKENNQRKKITEILKSKGFIQQNNAHNFNWKIPLLKKEKISVASVQQKIKQQKRNFQEEIASQYELAITQAGSFIGKEKNKIKISEKGKTIKIVSLTHLKHICIMKEGVAISSSVSKACIEKDIVISHFDSHADCFLIQHSGATAAHLMELQINQTEQNKQDAAYQLMLNKLNNQYKLIKYYAKYYKKQIATQADLQDYLQKMEVELLNIRQTFMKKEDWANQIFLTEAQFALLYWSSFRLLVEQAGYVFEKRIGQGAKDLVNQMLNYGYALLENRVERAILGVHLSPYLGILHKGDGKKKNLVFDFMEQYRPFVVDRAVLAILSKHKKGIAQEDNLLSLSLRKLLITKINEYFVTWVSVKQDKITLADYSYLIMEHYISFLKGEKNKLKLYHAKW